MWKRYVIVLGLGLIATGVLAAPPKKLFVNKLQATNMKASAAEAIDIAVCDAAHVDKRFDVTCPSEVKDVLAYDSTMAMLGASPECEGGDCNERLAKRVQSDYLLSGSIAKLAKGKYLLTLELVETASAKTLGRVEEQVSGSGEATFERARGAVKKLLAQLK